MLAGQFSQYFSDRRALLPYSLLGLVAGLLSAAAVLLFEWQIAALGSLWLGEGSPDSFESLPAWQRFAIPCGAAVALGAIYHILSPSFREVGIVHVLSRMHSHYGQLPFRNALVQFFGGSLSLAAGISGGREGPGVHLGAALLRCRRQPVLAHQLAGAAREAVRVEADELNARHVRHDHATGAPLLQEAR